MKKGRDEVIARLIIKVITFAAYIHSLRYVRTKLKYVSVVIGYVDRQNIYVYIHTYTYIHTYIFIKKKKKKIVYSASNE